MITKIYLEANPNDDFVGFEYTDEIITIYYPITLNLFNDDQTHRLLDCSKDKDAIKILSILIQSFSLADSKDLANEKSPNKNSKEKVVDYPIEAYQRMIEDYHRNGRYIEFETKYAMNGNGKIDWKKTLRQMPMIINGSSYYHNVVTKQKVIASDIMNDIYMYCVYESVFKFGSWFYGMNCNTIPTKVKQLKKDLKKLYSNTLENKLSETFDDDINNRLNDMLMIINGAKDYDGVQRMGLKTYHSVFERLIKWCFNNVDDLRVYNPRAVWNSEEADNTLSPLRLDALRIDNQSAYIIDAKFYQSSLPGAADINKQITYGENLYINHDVIVEKGQFYNKDAIFNCFVVPKASACMDPSHISKDDKVGKGFWRKNNHSFDTIHLLHIDLQNLLVLWSKNNRQPLIDEFKDNIIPYIQANISL